MAARMAGRRRGCAGRGCAPRHLELEPMELGQQVDRVAGRDGDGVVSLQGGHDAAFAHARQRAKALEREGKLALVLSHRDLSVLPTDARVHHAAPASPDHVCAHGEGDRREGRGRAEEADRRAERHSRRGRGETCTPGGQGAAESGLEQGSLGVKHASNCGETLRLAGFLSSRAPSCVVSSQYSMPSQSHASKYHGTGTRLAGVWWVQYAV